MTKLGLFSGEWLRCSGGATDESMRLRFVEGEQRFYELEFMYHFDYDEQILLRFEMNPEEVETMKSELRDEGYVKVTGTKNGHPFLLEMRYVEELLEFKLRGAGMIWPGHPHRLSMTQFRQILESIDVSSH